MKILNDFRAPELPEIQDPGTKESFSRLSAAIAQQARELEVSFSRLAQTKAWTPAISFATPGDLSVTYSIRTARYTKIGRLILLDFNLLTSAFTHTTAAGLLIVTGLPAAARTETNYGAFGSLFWGGIVKAGYTDMEAVILSGESRIRFAGSGSGVGYDDLTAADVPTGGAVRLAGSIAYLA